MRSVFDENVIEEAVLVTKPAPLAIVKKRIRKEIPSRDQLIDDRERNGFCKSVSSAAYYEDEGQHDVARALYISRAAIPIVPKGIRYDKRQAPLVWGWLEDRIYELRDWIADLPFPWGPRQRSFKAEIQWCQYKSGNKRDRLRSDTQE